MQDERIVKLLIRRPDDTYLVLRRSWSESASSTYDLPGGSSRADESDVEALDRFLDDKFNLTLFTESAQLTGEDTQYIPGEGLKSHALYLLFDKEPNRYIPQSADYAGHEWRTRSDLRVFDPIWQSLVQVAIDFYAPPEVA